MSDEVSFVEGKASDAEDILNLIQQLENETDSIEFDAAIHSLNLTDLGHNLSLLQQSPTNFLLIAKLDEQPIGIVTLVETDEQRPSAELGVGVLKEYWHNGIGTALVDEALYWAANFSQLNLVWLDVLESNLHAVRLYQNFEFQTKTTSIKDDQNRSVIRMELELI